VNMTPLRLLILCVLVVCSTQVDEHSGGFGSRIASVMEPRLGVNIARIIQLEKHIEKIRERLEEAKHVDPEQFVDDVTARIHKLEGSHCEEKEFQCGEMEECIHDLFVCDGHNDCHNHYDEDEHVCSTEPVKAGNIFTGMVHWTSCQQREDHVIHINIVSMKRFKYFPGRLVIRAVVESIHDEDGKEVTEKIHVHGGYNFAHRRLVLIPDDEQHEDERLAIRCEFDHGDDERADCEMVFQGSLHKCAEIHVSLEHHEDEDEEEHHSDAGHHGFYDTTHHEEHHEGEHDKHHGKHHGKHDDDHDEHHGKHHGKHHDDDDRKHHGKHHDDDDKHHGKHHGGHHGDHDKDHDKPHVGHHGSHDKPHH